MLLQGGSALRLPQTDDAILEANLGDVLLFLHDAAHPQKTVVASAYTHNVYYTLFTDAGGSHTQIMKGAVDAVAEACAEDASHLATLSTARKHRLWNLSPSNLTRPLTRGAMTLFRRSSQTPHVGNEKNPCSDAVCGNSTTSPDCASVFAEQSLLVKDEDAGKEEKEKGLENWSLTNDVAREQEVLLVAYGKGAPPYVKDCLRIEKHSITLSMPDARYELSIDDTNTPAVSPPRRGCDSCALSRPIACRCSQWTRRPVSRAKSSGRAHPGRR
ncbi:hypothetical protein L226DRAFT_205767 [Lentinus tigrinus ALCF2SS1-7]|uniref:uncharacterized protein n=1 Tax=Lentinus tigrinus ALCF2SS1-7 TaxID=1328758 RepID=UPI001165F70F|nr:hypothetical protein L226DRAFT_205767 [Lentinus tigrinus ALCF2SS1-7]